MHPSEATPAVQFYTYAALVTEDLLANPHVWADAVWTLRKRLDSASAHAFSERNCEEAPLGDSPEIGPDPCDIPHLSALAQIMVVWNEIALERAEDSDESWQSDMPRQFVQQILLLCGLSGCQYFPDKRLGFRRWQIDDSYNGREWIDAGLSGWDSFPRICRIVHAAWHRYLELRPFLASSNLELKPQATTNIEIKSVPEHLQNTGAREVHPNERGMRHARLSEHQKFPVSPTRPESLKRAAKWFLRKSDRVLKTAIEKGHVSAERQSPYLWVYELSQVAEEYRSEADPRRARATKAGKKAKKLN